MPGDTMKDTLNDNRKRNKRLIALGRVNREDVPVIAHRYTHARKVACQQVGVSLVEIYVGHQGSHERSYEMVPRYNGDCGIPSAVSLNDRSLKPGRVLASAEAN